jgi:hypothetical protein
VKSVVIFFTGAVLWCSILILTWFLLEFLVALARSVYRKDFSRSRALLADPLKEGSDQPLITFAISFLIFAPYIFFVVSEPVFRFIKGL